MVYAVILCRCLIGVIFAVSAFTKLRSRGAFHAFASWIDELPILPVLPGRHRTALTVSMATTEVIIVAAVALPWTPMAGLLLAAVTLAVFTAGTFALDRAQAGVACQCFGASASPLGQRDVVRNAVLCAVAAAGTALAAQRSAGSGSAHPAGIVLSLWGGATVAMAVVFLDDLSAFFTKAAATMDSPAMGLEGKN
ncbi:MAG: hypothetical protein JO345_19925 [Streptosporangiaceae bacterium]|nr:hypothetical protein [Streptosporangiaceae bacterium]